PEGEDAVAEDRRGQTAAGGRERRSGEPAVRGRIVDLYRRVLTAQERLASAHRPEAPLEGDRGEMIARRGHRRPFRPAVGRRIVDLMGSRRALAAAADGVEAPVEGDEGERSTRGPERRARRPGVPRRVVLIDRRERGPADTPRVPAGDEEAPAHDSRREVVRRGGEWHPHL